VWLGDTAVKEIFLTFDAGYEAGYTSGLLDVLRDEGVGAAFFLTGHYLKTQPELVKRMVAEGHTVGNHTHSHPSMPSLDAAGMRAEIVAVASRFEALTGVEMPYFRPPSGELSERVLAVARGLGYVTVMWSLAYKDWEPMPGGPEESYRTLMARLHNGAVILLHVTSKDNAQALQGIIRSAKGEGYAFGSLGELYGRQAQQRE
jgi:peptidoglycan-N-acetylmuramic acid deacetylase